MSNYRDDSVDTLVISDSSWLGLSALGESTLKASETALFRLRVIHADELTISDEDRSVSTLMASDSLLVAESYHTSLVAKGFFSDALKIRDEPRGRLAVLHEDTLAVADEVIEALRSVASDTLKVSAEPAGKRKAAVLVVDTVKIADSMISVSRELASDDLTVGDEGSGRARAKIVVSDALVLSDEILAGGATVSFLAVDSLIARSEVFGTLHATDLLTDTAVIDDEAVGEVVPGQAWTANVETWAVSRYAPFTFITTAVVNDQLYGLADDGVYRLGVEGEVIEAVIQTAKMDMGGGIARPLTAYIQSDMDNTAGAALAVTTTQNQAAETFEYPMDAHGTGHARSGRFVLGRGLRGRQFGFTLKLKAKRAQIDDMSIETMPIGRRV